jgi:amino acid adenylation domain-containing protein
VQRLWFLSKLGLGGSHANICALYVMQGACDLDAVRKSLAAVAQPLAHLRTLVASLEGDEAVRPDDGSPLYTLNAVTLDQPNHQAFVDAHAAELESGAFDLRAGPLLNVHMYHTGADETLFAFAASRLVLDIQALDALAHTVMDWAHSSAHSLPAAPIPALNGRPYGLSGPVSLEQMVEELKSAAWVCELPSDYPRPREQTANRRYLVQPLSPAVQDALLRACSERAGSFKTLALAAYAALIYRYTHQDDMLLGLFHRPANMPAFGAQANVGILRLLLDESLSGDALIDSLAHALTAYPDDQPGPDFADVVERLNPGRDLSRSPLVQHGFAHLTPRANPTITPLYVSAPIAQMDVMLTLLSHGEQTQVVWHYDSGLFEPSTIARLSLHYERLLMALTTAAETPIGGVVLTSPDELHTLTTAWNQTDAEVADFDFVYRLFEKQAARTPTRTAVFDPEKRLTYAALNHKANRLAHRLVELGVGADAIVALHDSRSVDYLVAMLAINKAGGAFLPLSPDYPHKRIAQIIEKSGARLIIASARWLGDIHACVQGMNPDARPAVLDLQAMLMETEDYPAENLPSRCGYRDLAYVMFTSGSTGEPKGVMVEHTGMINHNYAKLTDLEMTADDILAQTGRQTFDIMVWQFVAPLIIGAAVAVLPDELALDPVRLLTAAEAYGITLLQLVPVNIELVLDAAHHLAEQAPRLSKLRWMIPTGDSLPTELCRQWLSKYPHTRMLNTYGATECSDDQCHAVIVGVPPSSYRPTTMTIGRPILNTQVYILDSYGNPCPVGVIGELYIAGIGVGRGYLKEPERTAAVFVPNPFSAEPNARMYRSGDLARYLADGSIEFLGRVGHMVKIRGFRIEPGEVQQILNRHPAVSQSLVSVYDSPETGSCLVAYVVAAHGRSFGEEALRAFMRQHLPEYMLPQYLVPIDAIPLTANGKPDRKALPPPRIDRPARTIVRPRDAVEAGIARIWSDLLNIGDICVTDDFFDIGGHSLLALKMVMRIEAAFGRTLPLSTIFQVSTIADLAKLLASQTPATPELTCVRQIQSGSPGRLPLFCIHAHGGHVLMYRALAKGLGADQPVYGIQALGVDGDAEPLDDFIPIAKHYIDEIKQTQPHGPYRFIGDCMGGTIGFEITRQLEASGDTVELLVMVDSFFNGKPQYRPGVSELAYELMFTAGRFAHYHVQRLVRADGGKLRLLRELLDTGVSAFQRRVLRRVVSAPASDPLTRTQDALTTAEKNYRPGIIRTPITLFNGRLPWGVVKDDTLGWSSATTGGIEVHTFDTYFGTILENDTSTRAAAEALRNLLDAGS